MDIGVLSLVEEIQKTAINYRQILPAGAGLKIEGFFGYHKLDYDKLSREQEIARLNDFKSVVLGA